MNTSNGPLLAPHAKASFFALIGLATSFLVACTPLVRDAPFRGAAEQVTDGTLRGPFDGKIVDASTGEPIADAIVVGVWSYDSGAGVYGPSGSDEVEVVTDAAGRYRIPVAPYKNHGADARLVHFRLLVYKRGYAAYRSDRHMKGGVRQDFTVRHNTIKLHKWSETDSHADHGLFLRAPRAVRLASKWESHLANLDLRADLTRPRRRCDYRSRFDVEYLESQIEVLV